MTQLPPKLVIVAAGLFFFFLAAGGSAAYLLISNPSASDYPNGFAVEGTSRCGTTTWLQRGRSIRAERYRCIVTTDSQGEVFVWYIRHGYTPLNGGLAQKEVQQQIIPIIKLKRIYPIEQKDGTTMIRIYDDITVRFPKRLSYFP